MERGGAKRIVVGNATMDLVTQCEQLKPETVYFAKASFAAGVVEGCHHFGVLCAGPPK